MKEIQEKGKFLWVGNQPAVDFINTRIVADGKPVDLLTEPDDVVLWLREAGFSSGGSTPSHLPKPLLDEARAYRLQLHESVVRLTKGKRLPADLLAATNGYLSRHVSWPQLRQKGALYQSVTERRFEQAPDFMVPIAQSFAQLVSEYDLERLRKCRNPDCVLYFYDTSKSGHRAWCSLDLCGNKLRMAASRQRRAGIVDIDEV